MSYSGYRRGRRRRYSGWSGRSGGPSKYSELARLFGTAVGAIRQAFLALQDDAIDELLADYGEIHGDSAERYARKAYPKWRSGETGLSGQTMERLVTLVPPYLSPEQRFEIMRAVVDKHRPLTPYLNLHVDPKRPEEGFAKIDAALDRMRKEDILANVPASVLSAANWLCDHDMTAARALLAASEGRENEILRVSAVREIEVLKQAIRSGHVKQASYSVRMPAGNLSVSVYKQSSCFVATACFGNQAPETAIFRRWRDQKLRSTVQGRRFIAWYYRNGPALAKAARTAPGALPVVRWALRQLARILQWRERP